MKLPDIEYVCPATLDEAVRFLSDGEAKILSGGQSLMPMMAYRLATPSMLVDIGRIPELNQIRFSEEGISLGSRVRWRDIESSARLCTEHPLLCEGIQHVAHYQIRNRGTVGGSIAHADPAAEMPAIAIACDARIIAFGTKGWRDIDVGEFFVGPLMSCLEPTDIVTEIRLPKWPAHRKFAFEEFARRRGDFALAGVCLFYDLDSDDCAVDPRVVGFGAIDMPARIAEVEEFLQGKRIDAATCELAGSIAKDAISPSGDLHASPEYRRSLLGTLVERALIRSISRETGVKE
jgi:carbon-monoxide dehydrogenase medium subunit